LVEHATENRGVPSPILGLGTPVRWFDRVRGRSTVVVRLLAKEKVVGSNPIARSNMKGCGLESVPSAILIVYMASWPSGKARVCKTLIRGSNPLDASSKANREGLLFLFGDYHEKFAKKVYNQLWKRHP
jgi:hypothetical protein